MPRKTKPTPSIPSVGILGPSTPKLDLSSPAAYARHVKAEMRPEDWYLFRMAALRAVGEKPHPGQQAIHARLDFSRFNLVTGGERSGKSRLVAQYVFSRLLAPFLFAAVRYQDDFTRYAEKMQFSLEDVYQHLGRTTTWLVGNTYGDTEEEFTYIAEMMLTAGWIPRPTQNHILTPKEGAWEMTLMYGGVIQTRSTADQRRMARVSPDIIVMCEAAQQSEEIVRRARTRISESRGVLLLAGTQEPGAEWFAQLFEAWGQAGNDWGAQAFSMPTWENTAIFPGGRNDPEIRELEATLPTEAFLERIAAIPVRRHGRVIPEFGEDNISEAAEYVAGRPVYLGVDPGWSQDSPYAVVAIQEQPADTGESILCVFDEIYVSFATGLQVAQAVLEKPWYKDVVSISIDIAARQHHGGPSQEEIWAHATGAHIPIYARHIQDINVVIDAYRVIVRHPITKRPGLLVHPRCRNLIMEHNQWCYPQTKGPFSRTTNARPPDRYNHAIKAICYYVLNARMPAANAQPLNIPWRVGREVTRLDPFQHIVLPEMFRE